MTADAVPFAPLSDARRGKTDRDSLVADHLGLARAAARSFRRRDVDQDDLEQVAALGLVKAARGYDPEVGDFAPYADVTIRGEVKRYLRDRTWRVRPPRGVQELRLRLLQDNEVPEKVTSDVVDQLAAAHDVPASDVVEALRAGDENVTSLDQPLGAGGCVGDLVGALRTGFEELETHIDLWASLRRLEPEERRIVRWYFFDCLTQDEIADRLGVSQMTVSRRLRKALDGLRSDLEVGEDDSA